MGDLNMAVDLAASILGKKSLNSIGIAVCPILPSEKAKNTIRGEIRSFCFSSMISLLYNCMLLFSDPTLVRMKNMSCLAPKNMNRRIEDKLDARGLYSEYFSIRMSAPPATKKVPLQFHAWMIFEEATTADNIFEGCQLMLDRQGCRTNQLCAAG